MSRTTTTTADAPVIPMTAMTGASSDAARWNAIVAPYKTPDLRRSLFQLITTSLLLAGGWYLALRSLEVGYWLTCLLAFPLAGLMTRMFIFQHDCGHGSFFRSARANHTVGFAIGVLMLTPYMYCASPLPCITRHLVRPRPPRARRPRDPHRRRVPGGAPPGGAFATAYR